MKSPFIFYPVWQFIFYILLKIRYVNLNIFGDEAKSHQLFLHYKLFWSCPGTNSGPRRLLCDRKDYMNVAIQ